MQSATDELRREGSARKTCSFKSWMSSSNCDDQCQWMKRVLPCVDMNTFQKLRVLIRIFTVPVGWPTCWAELPSFPPLISPPSFRYPPLQFHRGDLLTTINSAGFWRNDATILAQSSSSFLTFYQVVTASLRNLLNSSLRDGTTSRSPCFTFLRVFLRFYFPSLCLSYQHFHNLLSMKHFRVGCCVSLLIGVVTFSVRIFVFSNFYLTIT